MNQKLIQQSNSKIQELKSKQEKMKQKIQKLEKENIKLFKKQNEISESIGQKKEILEIIYGKSDLNTNEN